MLAADDPEAEAHAYPLPIPVVAVPPITMFEAAEGYGRTAARATLGLPEADRIVVVLAGGGGDEEACRTALRIADVIERLVAEWLAHVLPGEAQERPRARLLTGSCQAFSRQIHSCHTEAMRRQSPRVTPAAASEVEHIGASRGAEASD